MTDFVIHGLAASPYVRAVRLALQEKGAAYEVRSVAFGTPAHLETHPFARIPAFEHGDFRLFETQAILRYIDRVLPDPPLMPDDPRGAARMDQLMGINDWYMFGEVNRVIGFQRVVKPMLLGQPTDEAACAAAEPLAVRCIDAIAGMLGDHAFMAGDRLTLADLLLVTQLDMFAPTPEGARTLAPHTNLRGWLERMRERPSLRATGSRAAQ